MNLGLTHFKYELRGTKDEVAKLEPKLFAIVDHYCDGFHKLLMIKLRRFLLCVWLSVASCCLLAPPAYSADMWQQLSRLHDVRFVQAAESELPEGLVWHTGAEEPPLGSPQARKGGAVRLSSPGPFPANLLAFGSPTPQFFHYNAFACIELPLVQQHPRTHGTLPGVAQAWAVQGRTVYFRLHPAARYSNGRPVRAADYALGALLRARAGQDGAWAALASAAEELCVYGDAALALTLRREGPMAELRAAALLHAAEPGFYAEFGGDYATRYAWRTPPTTGAYVVGRVERGRMVELRRVADWWAADLPHYRHVFNVDSIEYHFLTDEAQAWEFFMRGKLDVMQTRHVPTWQRRLEGAPEVDSGRICCRNYVVEQPLPPYGIALNTATLPDVRVRQGLLQAMDMDRAVRFLFRGEAERLRTFTGGYGRLSPEHTPQYIYDPAAARACFASAGYTQAGADGILRRADGARLSVPLCYVPSEKVSTLVRILCESARACGAEIVPEPLPWQLCAHKVREGKHSMTFWAAVPSTPLPQPGRHLSSRAAGDDAPFCLNSAEMDAALAASEHARTLPELAAAVARVDRLVYELALWLPGWKENRVYLAHWQRICFPEQPSGHYDAMDSHSFWCREGGKQ